MHSPDIAPLIALRAAMLRRILHQAAILDGAGTGGRRYPGMIVDAHFFWGQHGDVMRDLGVPSGRANTMTQAQIRRAIAALPPPQMHEIEALFTRLMREPGTRLPSGRGDFKPDAKAHMDEVLRACAGLSWAIPTISGGYRWSDKVTPFMVAAGRWREDGASWEDTARAGKAYRQTRLEAQTAQDLETIPATFRAHLLEDVRLSGFIDSGFIETARRMDRYHDGRAWRDTARPDLPPAAPQMGLSRAHRLLRALVQSGSN